MPRDAGYDRPENGNHIEKHQDDEADHGQLVAS